MALTLVRDLIYFFYNGSPSKFSRGYGLKGGYSDEREPI
jgi:hypothetical protein